jgi:hypothetical protein
VKQILNEVVTKVLVKKPDDVAPHIVQVLHELKGDAAEPLSKDERRELLMLRQEVEKLKEPQATVMKKLTFE